MLLLLLLLLPLLLAPRDYILAVNRPCIHSMYIHVCMTAKVSNGNDREPLKLHEPRCTKGTDCGKLRFTKKFVDPVSLCRRRRKKVPEVHWQGTGRGTGRRKEKSHVGEKRGRKIRRTLSAFLHPLLSIRVGQSTDYVWPAEYSVRFGRGTLSSKNHVGITCPYSFPTQGISPVPKSVSDI